MLTGSIVFAQSDTGGRYFPETGHWITGPFLEKYSSVSKPGEMFGLPITDQFVETGFPNLTVQYFEKVRFELHPEDAEDLQVHLTDLGFFLYEKGQTLPDPVNSPVCEAYQLNNQEYSICYAFLDYFKDNGGIAQFGYPISNFEVHEGWIVQYFQRARFEWHPENPAGNRVTISNLGTRYFYFVGEDTKLLRPARNLSDAIIKPPTVDIKTRAFAASAVTSTSGSQVLYVIVQDQNRNPVENASINFEVVFPDGTILPYHMDFTDENGITSQRFAINGQDPGFVEIKITATYRTMQSQTKTSFQIWW
jgi:hypothetical protein